MNLRLLKPDDQPLLAAFVAEHPHGSIEQTWDFGVLQTSIPGRSAFFVFGLFDKDRLVGSALLVRQHMGMGRTWLWCPRGPLLPQKEGMEAWEQLKGGIEALARKDGDIFVRVEPGCSAENPLALGGKVAPDSYLPEHTLTLNLKLDEKELLKQMTQKGRYNIKIAEREGVYVRKADTKGLADFFELLKETAVRDGFSVHGFEFYKKFLGGLDEKAFLYLAHIGHECVGGLMGTQFGDTVTYYFGASSNKHRQKMAPYALQWFAIREAREHGFKRYDFLGVAPEGNLKHALSGVTQFKTRFGGERLDYQKAQVFIYRPVWWLLYRLAKRFR